MDIITANEAKSKALQLMKEDNECLSTFFSWVRRESDEGNLSGNFFTGGWHFTDDELDFIESLNYEITWNRPCLWYEVNWK